MTYGQTNTNFYAPLKFTVLPLQSSDRAEIWPKVRTRDAHHAPFYRILKDGVVLENEQFVVFKERICLIQEETSPRAKHGERFPDGVERA